jgi:hypothetical protein
MEQISDLARRPAVLHRQTAAARIFAAAHNFEPVDIQAAVAAYNSAQADKPVVVVVVVVCNSAQASKLPAVEARNFAQAGTAAVEAAHNSVPVHNDNLALG